MHILFAPFGLLASVLLAVLHVVGLLLRALCILLMVALLAWLVIGFWLAWYAGDPSHLIAVVIIFMVLGAVTQGSSLYWMAYLPVHGRRDGMHACLDE